jgi:hypothetical protein
MTNPTTYFGWQMPEPTDLVTDLPADFEVFGQAVDTDLQDLLGGTTGQVLSKTSGTDLDFTWVDPTAGDITGVTAGTGISGGGISGTVTVTNSMATAIDAKGDLIAGTADDTFDRLAVGANNTVLTADSTETSGLKWATPSSPTLPAFSAYGVAVNQTLVASTDTKVTFNTEEYDTDGCFASNRFTPTKAGYYVISAYFSINAPSSATTRMYLWKNGAPYKYLESKYAGTGDDDLNGTAQVYLNGTSDYVEIYALSTQATTIYKNIEYGYFQGVGATA